VGADVTDVAGVKYATGEIRTECAQLEMISERIQRPTIMGLGLGECEAVNVLGSCTCNGFSASRP
jgi:hypothetical protein